MSGQRGARHKVAPPKGIQNVRKRKRAWLEKAKANEKIMRKWA